MMQRQVLINDQEVDIFQENNTSYEFKSPLLSTFSDITANRTYECTLPVTEHNLQVFKYPNASDIEQTLPYQKLSFEERRGGATFIEGICNIVSVSSSEISLTVVWGNSIKLVALKDLELRDLELRELPTYIRWNEDSNLLEASSSENIGFLVADYGKGVLQDEKLSIKTSIPSVNAMFILRAIEENTLENNQPIKFIYPSRFTDIFQNMWFPMVDMVANGITWNDPRYFVGIKTEAGMDFGILNQEIENSGYPYSSLFSTQMDNIVTRHLITMNQTEQQIHSWGVITKKDYISRLKADFTIRFPKELISNRKPTTVRVVGAVGRGVPYLKNIWEMEYVVNDLNAYLSTGVIQLDLSHTGENDTDLVVILFQCRYDDSNEWEPLPDYAQIVGGKSIDVFGDAYIYKDKLQFGDKVPTVANLPDIKVTDFIKGLCNMYGLFTYYNYNSSEGEVQFFSIDDLYSSKEDGFKQHTVDYTANKQEDGNEVRTFKYQDYANRNNLLYKEDKNVDQSQAGGTIYTEGVLESERTLYTLPWSPSDNEKRLYNNFSNEYEIMKVPVFNTKDDDEDYNNISIRVGFSKKIALNKIEFKALEFPLAWHFDGPQGLINTHYRKWQQTIRKPLILKTTIYMDEYEQFSFREVYPIVMDGVYYTPLTAIMQGELVELTLLMMPVDALMD